jgi:ankyrin repeat protein
MMFCYFIAMNNDQLLCHARDLYWEQALADIHAGADVNYYHNALDTTPFFICYKSIVERPEQTEDGLRTIQVLLDNRASFYTVFTYTPFWGTFNKRRHVDLNKRIIDLIIASTPDLNQTNGHAMTLLMNACAFVFPYAIHRLVETGAEVNSCTPDLETPLHFLCYRTDECEEEINECIEWMVLKAEANINAQNSRGYTPWMLLVIDSYVESIDVDPHNRRMRCVKNVEDSLIYRIFNSTYIDLSLTTKTGDTALSLASKTIRTWLEKEMTNVFSYVLK